MNGAPKNLRVAPAGTTNGAKVDPNDPQVRKLVYNAYREMLSKKHAASNVIVDSAPQAMVTKDMGVGDRVESMMRQQSELKGGNMNAGGPPPPPPPPPIPGAIPVSRLPSEIPSRSANMNQPPAALASAMMKDRKPFTYTPGGLDLSEIRSPRMQRRLYRNAQSEGVKPSPLAQQPQQGHPDAAVASQSAAQGLAIQVLPMPGVGMGPHQQPQPQSKEAPKPKPKSVCGPAPPPPPFVVSSDNSFTMPVSSPQSSIPSTISSPPISSSPTSPAAPQPQLAKEPGPSIPMAPPLPTQNFAARRGSLIIASPPTSPLVSTLPCEPSPPPLPPPQAVRVPVTPPIIQEALPSPAVQEEKPVIQSPQTLISPPAMMSPLEATVSQDKFSPHIESDVASSYSSDSPQFQLSSSTPVENLNSTNSEPLHVSPPVPIINSVHEISPVPQEYEKELSPLQPVVSKEQTPIEQVPIAESSPSQQMVNRESVAASQVPVLEPSPVRQVSIKDSSPVRPVMMNEPSPVKQVLKPEPNLIDQVIAKEPSPVQSAKVKEASLVKDLPSKEPTPVEVVPNNTSPPVELQQVSDIPISKQVLARQPMAEELPENEPPIIFSPIPVKEMPIKEPTPVRQIVREPTPVKQATLEKPVVSEPAVPKAPCSEVTMAPSKPIPSQNINTVKQAPTSETSVLRQVPVQQPGIKRQSSMPDAPFVTNIPIQQPTIITQTTSQPSAPVSLSTQKSSPSKQTTFSQPLPVKPVPVKSHNESVTHTVPVRMPSPPPSLMSTSAPASSKGTKLARQASLPTKPSSPLVSPPNAQLGSIYVPPLTGEEITNAGPMSPSADRSPRRSPTSGLHRAPLPWMCGQRKEQSPPPLFVQHAQQTLHRFQPQQSRFIRQSSLGPELSPTENLAQNTILSQSNVRQHPVFQRQQSLPPPQRQQQQPQPQPARIQQQYKVQPQQQQQQQPIQQQQQFNPQQQKSHPQQQQFNPQQQQFNPQQQQATPQQQQPQLQQQPRLQHQQSQVQNQQRNTQQQQILQQHQQHPQTQSQSIRSQHPQSQQSPQARIIPIQVQQPLQPKQKPRERIIPIMIESDSPPRESAPLSAPTATTTTTHTNAAQNERFIPIRIDGNAAPNSAQQSPQQPQSYLSHQKQPMHQPQPTWTNSPGKGFNHPTTTLSGGQSGAFLPYNSSSSTSAEKSSNNNPLDALHQMQQSLAQLNSGLENAFPRFIQKKMSDTITPRTTPSNQSPPNQNGNNVDQAPNSADFGAPVQSRSFRVLQNVLDHQDTADSPTSGVPMKVEVPLGAPTPYFSQQNGGNRGSFSQQGGTRGSISHSTQDKRGSFSHQGGQRGSISQMSDGRQGSFSNQSGQVGSPRGSFSQTSNDFSRSNGPRGSVGNIKNVHNQENSDHRVSPETGGLRIIQQSVGGVSKIILGQNGGSEPTSPDTKELSNIFKNQVRISANTDEARTRGGHFPTKNISSGQKTEPQGPIHIPAMRPSQHQSQYQPQPNQYHQQPVYQQQTGPYLQSGVNNVANTEQTVPEPKKYMGGNIPSRSFRMLQAMTGSDDVAGPGQSDL